MKKSALLVLLVAAIIYSASGQSGSHKVRLYDSWYYLRSGTTLLNTQFTAYTYSINDSSVTVVDRDVYKYSIQLRPEDLRTIPADQIYTLKFRMKGSMMIGVGLGIAGVLIGGIWGGISEGEPWQKPLQVLGGVLLGGVIGFGIGIPLGSAKKVFHIHGSMDTYRARRLEMIPYSIDYYAD